jgi:hypothetical protein
MHASTPTPADAEREVDASIGRPTLVPCFRASVVFSLVRAVIVALPPLLLVSALYAAPKKPTPPPKKPPVSKTKDAGADAADAPKGPAEKVADAAPIPKASATKSEGGDLVKETEKKEGDAAVKVFEFGTTEIEGRARWPAVTYFVRRMRAEFEAQKLPHRPFLPELESTKGDPAVK